MKKIVAIVLAFVMVCLCVTPAVAISGLPYYNGDYYANAFENRGEINANKHELIQRGIAGNSYYDDTTFTIPGVRGSEIPVIDGQASTNEGYKNFQSYADYLYVLANIDMYSASEFKAWYDEVKDMDLIVKSCWDGKYIYFYFEYEVKDYVCFTTTATELWKWNCIQFGLAEPYAMAYDFSETIYGVNSSNNASYAGATHGSYTPAANSDYKGTLSNGRGSSIKVTHEFRVDIAKALQKNGPINEFDTVKLCWVVMNNNLGSHAGQKGISFGHGITGRESAKFAQHFVNVTLGDGIDETVDTPAGGTVSGGNASVYVTDASAVAGGTVKVDVKIKNNPGFASLKFDVIYDEALTLKDVEFNSELGSNITTSTPYQNPQTINIVSPLDEITYDGTIVTLTFEVAATVEDGYVADIKIEYEDENVFDGDFNNITLSVSEGSVTAFDNLPGDLDGDGKVTNKDAILLFRYTTGWDVDINTNAIDVTGDGKANNKDVITLFRYVAGWEDIVLYRGSAE